MTDAPAVDGSAVYGTLGVLAYDPIEDRIQCHVCGRWLQKIEARHLAGHDLSIPGYKARYGLNEKTPLEIPRITERRREANRTHQGWRNLRPDGQFQPGHVDVRRGAVRAQFRREHFDPSTQQQRAQVWTDEEMLTYLRDVQRQCGGELRLSHLNRNRPGGRGVAPSRNAVIQRFGSWKHICELLGQPYRIGAPRTTGAWSNQGYAYRTLLGAFQAAVPFVADTGGEAVVALAPHVMLGMIRSPKFWTDGTTYRVYEDVESGAMMAHAEPVPDVWRPVQTRSQD